MPLDGVSALALLLLCAFVVERVVSGALFVLPSLGGVLSDPTRSRMLLVLERRNHVREVGCHAGLG